MAPAHVTVERIAAPRAQSETITRVEAGDDPFLGRAFLAAAAHHGPGRGEGIKLEAGPGSGASARWGVVERSQAIFKAAMGFTRPASSQGGDRARAWSVLLDALAERGNALIRLSSHSSLRLSAEDVEAIDRVARERRWGSVPGRFGTYVMDLDAPEEKRLASMNESHRRSVKSASKTGLRLERLAPTAFEDYMDLSDATYARQGLPGLPRPYLAGLFGAPHSFRFYVARDGEGRSHACAIVAVRDATGIYLHGGSGDRAVNGAGNWLHWEVSRALAADGFRHYDLGGVDVDSEAPKAAGIRTFKARFGGRLEIHPARDVVFRPLRYRLIQWGLSLTRRNPAPSRARSA